MTEQEIRDALKTSFKSADEIWGAESPFAEGSTWIGFAADQDATQYLDQIFGNKARSFAAGDADHTRAMGLIQDLLPQGAQQLLLTGYTDEKLYATPATTPWTPTALCVTMAEDPNDGNRKFTLFTAGCGAARK